MIDFSQVPDERLHLYLDDECLVSETIETEQKKKSVVRCPDWCQRTIYAWHTMVQMLIKI